MSRYLHIFSDAPYTYKFINFIKENFDYKNHFFIILCTNQEGRFIEFYKTQKNCRVTENKNIYFHYKDRFKVASQVLIHQLNKPLLMATLSMFYPSIFYKMVWIIWGGDVYFYKYKTNSLKDNLLELLRKYTIKKIPTIVSYIKGDYDKVVEIYKTDAKYIKAWYPSPIDVEMIALLPMKTKEDKITRVVVGNSADPSNDHLETFSLLEKFKDKNIEIYSVLSYGGSKAYIDKVISEGKRIFKNKFKPILEYMSFEDYLDFINNSDICILNHKRQQGLGNQLVFFILNKKVYISNTTTPFKYYKENGIDIYSVESISNMNYEDFVLQSESSKDANRILTLADNNVDKLKKDWMEVFNDSR